MALIEDGIEIPAFAGGDLPRSSDLPFEKMIVGQSVHFCCVDGLKQKVSARMHAYAAAKIGSGKIRTRQDVNGVRAWRIA